MNFGAETPAIVPLCWPSADGRCGYGRRDRETGNPQPHTNHDVGKAPLVGWKRYVHTPPSRALVAAWWKRWPQANVGLLLEPHALIVIDPDSHEALAEARALGLPRTLTVRTAKGLHFYYRCPAGAPARRALNRTASRKLDVLSAGYITVPPSRHRLQVTYTIIEPAPVVPASAWAIRFLLEAPAPIDRVVGAELPVTVGEVDLGALAVSLRIKRLIIEGHDPERYPSVSEARWGALQALIAAGVDDSTIAAVMLDARFGISAKPRAEGRCWLAREIGRARAKSDVLILP